MKTAWIVSEGSPGHVSQSVGLTEALSAIVPMRTVVVKGRAKIRGWLRPVVRKIMGPAGQPLSEKMLHWVANLDIPAKSPVPDLIVSSGGKSVFVARTLAGRYGVPYVYIGERKPFPAELFHTVISPVPGEASDNSIDVELIPTPVTPEVIAQKGAVQKDVWCMIVGGASRSHRFCKKDWVDLAEGMNALADREKIRWLLTTSRRTGAAAEAVLKELLKPDFIEDAIWWADEPRKELYSFMARSEVLFVTQDSVTMVTEAVSSAKPVFVVYPEKVVSPRGSFLPAYLGRLEKNRRIERICTSELKQSNLDEKRLSPLIDSGMVAVAGELMCRLGWEESSGNGSTIEKRSRRGNNDSER